MFGIVAVCRWCGFSRTYDASDEVPQECPVCGEELEIVAFRGLPPSPEDSSPQGRSPPKRFGRPRAVRLVEVEAAVIELSAGEFLIPPRRLPPGLIISLRAPGEFVIRSTCPVRRGRPSSRLL
ncbi:MAG: hypothetical protein DRO06_04295 [Thermoproteota archaeon]|nr:MAG: hypothetical protein DRO06_04295 [Candidatus Korarchaeota archaeon]